MLNSQSMRHCSPIVNHAAPSLGRRLSADLTGLTKVAASPNLPEVSHLLGFTLLCLHASLTAELPVDTPLVPGAYALKESGRYQSTRSYEETLDFYRRLFNQTGGVRWRNIVNLPGM